MRTELRQQAREGREHRLHLTVGRLFQGLSSRLGRGFGVVAPRVGEGQIEKQPGPNRPRAPGSAASTTSRTASAAELAQRRCLFLGKVRGVEEWDARPLHRGVMRGLQ